MYPFRHFRVALTAVSLLVVVNGAPAPAASNVELPTVDLGYEIHQARIYNTTYNFYNFTNIPFAAPPLGELRFAPPQPPLKSSNATPNLGDGFKVCPNSAAGWISITQSFATSYSVQLLTVGSGNPDSIPVNSTLPPFSYVADPLASEDCLYLDVVVPKPIFEAGASAKAPVIVQIFGGGYVSGDKSGVKGSVKSGNGLIGRSGGKVIYVALNYRLGALGFAAGPTFTSQGGTANVGLLDQRFAIEWVRSHISKFGGDPDQITLLGESAGGGSIEHHIVAYGGKQGPAPFKRAIPQSPAFTPTKSNATTEQSFQDLLRIAGVASLAELRALPSEKLLAAQSEQIYNTKVIGTFPYGPVVDGTLIPDLPSLLISSGQFASEVAVLAGHNLREGMIFNSPFNKDDAALTAQIQSQFPSASSEFISEVLTNIYPANYSGQLYANYYERSSLITTEVGFICNNYYLNNALRNSSYAYLFNVFPSLHGQDIAYTFYAGEATNAIDFLNVQNAKVALTLQDYIVSFAISGVPTTTVRGSPNPPLYGSGSQLVQLDGLITQFSPVLGADNADNDRCRFWERAQFA